MSFIKCSYCGGDEVRFFGFFHDRSTIKSHCEVCGLSSWQQRRKEKLPEIYYEVCKPK